LGKDRFIFGFPWGQTFKPDIDWVEGRIKGPQVQVETLLLGKYQRIRNFVKEKKALKQKEQEDIILELDRAECPPWSGVTPEETQGVGTEGSDWLLAGPVRMDQNKKHRGFYDR
jgi:hypothetical protein